MTANVRAPQQDRSRATRQALLEAAVEALAELGWSKTTVAIVAERAGVSRGAAQHHFPTRESLFTAAIDHVMEQRIADVQQVKSTLPTGPERTAAVVEGLFEVFAGPLFRAALEMWVAAASEPHMKPIVVPFERDIGREAHLMVVDLLGADESKPGVREAIQATLDLARGLGLANVLTDDSKRRERIAKQWAQMLDAALNA